MSSPLLTNYGCTIDYLMTRIRKVDKTLKYGITVVEHKAYLSDDVKRERVAYSRTMLPLLEVPISSQQFSQTFANSIRPSQILSPTATK